MCDLSTPLTDEERSSERPPSLPPSYRVSCVLSHSPPASIHLTPAGVPRTPHPAPTHADEAGGKPRERDVSLGGLGVGTAVAGPADVREAVAVGAEGHGRDQGHGAHGQREAPVEAPQLGRVQGPRGPSQAGGAAALRSLEPGARSHLSPPALGPRQGSLSFLSCTTGTVTPRKPGPPGGCCDNSGAELAAWPLLLLFRSPLAGTHSQVHFGKCP